MFICKGPMTNLCWCVKKISHETCYYHQSALIVIIVEVICFAKHFIWAVSTWKLDIYTSQSY